MSLRLRLRFDDAPSFHEEFRRNISKGGAFLSCAEATELRAIVEVELDLAFCGEHLVLEAEVVHVVPGSGVAVEFLKPAVELRDELAVFLGGDAATPPSRASSPKPASLPAKGLPRPAPMRSPSKTLSIFRRRARARATGSATCSTTWTSG